MKQFLPHQRYDAQTAGPQYLEDLATGYWYSEVLFTAVEMDLFSCLGEEGATVEELAGKLEATFEGVRRLIRTLVHLGLVTEGDGKCFNTKLSSTYLLKGRDQYQGHSILWRRHLRPGWQALTACIRKGGRVEYPDDKPSERVERIRKYILAMDAVAKAKTDEIVRFFEGRSQKGEILDVGTGSGAIAAAFLERFPETRATVMDLADVLEQSRELMSRSGLERRIQYCPANILLSWPLEERDFEIIILSNILHAYSERELDHILRSAANRLGKNGILLVHDFFFEHCPQKASLSDLNMFINTFNGRVFQAANAREQLSRLGLLCSELVPLTSDTAVFFASKEKAALNSLCLRPEDILVSRMRALGFEEVYPIKSEDIHISEWTSLKCRFGCGHYGSLRCPPNSPSAGKTRKIVKDYRRALLLQGEPPTRDFQLRVLKAEIEALKSGFHKALSFWAGPCSLCESCNTEKCRNTAWARPSMEGAGIDVYETVRSAGASLRTLNSKDEFVKYFALILLE
ncbi:MAG TPA: DUF2284 domain-containing protein [Nitrospirota bacterium]|nr:DUF2284 domain-containing protein [Nitrospirota bacterium]